MLLKKIGTFFSKVFFETEFLMYASSVWQLVALIGFISVLFENNPLIPSFIGYMLLKVGYAAALFFIGADLVKNVRFLRMQATKRY